jgi:hypothetical protein
VTFAASDVAMVPEHRLGPAVARNVQECIEPRKCSLEGYRIVVVGSIRLDPRVGGEADHFGIRADRDDSHVPRSTRDRTAAPPTPPVAPVTPILIAAAVIA